MPLNIGFIFDQIIVRQIANAVVLCINILESLHIPNALGFSIIILTVLIRLAVWPLVASQLKWSKKMADLKPELEKLKGKHKDDKKALLEAQSALYKENNISQAGGCLPTIVQVIVFIGFYQIIYSLFNGPAGLERINSLLYDQSWRLTSPPDPNFLGLNLTLKPSEFSHVGFLILLVPVATAALSFIQSKMMLPKPLEVNKKDSKVEKKEKESTDEAMAAMQSQMVFMMPLIIGYSAFNFPVGVALYWNASTIMSIIQQFLLLGWGGMSDWIKVLKRVK